MGLQGPKGQKGECQGKGNSQHSTKRFYLKYGSTLQLRITLFLPFFFRKKIIACTQCISINLNNFLCNKKIKNKNRTYLYQTVLLENPISTMRIYPKMALSTMIIHTLKTNISANIPVPSTM